MKNEVSAIMKLINEFIEFFKDCNAQWAVCGGHAIDLYLEKETRKHKDLDICVFWDDCETIIGYMLSKGWNVYEPANGKLRKIAEAESTLQTSSNIWCISPANNSYDIKKLNSDFYDIKCNTEHQISLDFVEFLFNKKANSQFVYRRNHNISLPMSKSIILTKQKVPILAPEIVLLYKSVFIRYLEHHDEDNLKMIADCRHDFDMAISSMKPSEVAWLKECLITEHPTGHEWINKINSYL